MSLQKDIEKYFALNEFTKKEGGKALSAFSEMVKLLNKGKVRSAEKTGNSWQANEWVKKGILLGFRLGKLKNYSIEQFKFYDKHKEAYVQQIIDDNRDWIIEQYKKENGINR